MKNAYFIQVDVSATSGTQTAYLPYTAGVLAAAAWESEIVRQNYHFGGFIFLRENIKEVCDKLDGPDFAAFSNYCWSTEYNKLLAKEIKKRWPDCLIVFGGHNVPDDFSFLEKFPYIDVLCHGEGENTVRLLMEAFAASSDISAVPNISYRGTEGGYIRTGNAAPGELASPSPYLGGWFDDIVDTHPEITFNAILETSRGCPNRCAYCDWGLLKSKVRLFPMDRVLKEIKWFSDHKIAFVWGADANFGMFDRDLQIAEALAEAKKNTGYPERMRMNYAKNNFENVFAIVKKFKECEFDRIGATLSFQSLSPAVLKNIGRTNADIDFYKNLLTKYNTEKMKTYSELILGLPGETYESFIKGIGRLFDIGQHFVFEVYGCILLPNSALGQYETVKKYGIQTVRTEIIRPHFENDAFSVPEYNTIVVATDTMSREMWVRSSVFYYFAKAFHGNGLLRAFAVYLHYHHNIPYEKFYDGILDYCEDRPGLRLSAYYREITKHLDEQSLGINNRKLQFAPAGDMVWDDHEYLVLNLLSDPDAFYREITPYLESYGIKDEIFRDLMVYQKNIMRKPLDETAAIELSYDIHAFLSDVYVNDIHALNKKPHTLIMRDPETMPDWKTFGKYVIWYGRMGWASYKDVQYKEEDK